MFLRGYDTQSRSALGAIQAGFDPDLSRQFDTHYTHINPYAPGWLSTPPGEVRHVDEMCARESVLASEFYADFLRPNEEATGGGGVPLFNDAGRYIAFGGHVAARHIDRIEDDFLRLLQLITPHMMQAFEVSRALGGVMLERHAEMDPIAQAAGAATEVVAVNASGRLLYASQPAEARLARGGVLRLGTGRRVSFCGRHEETVFRAALRMIAGAAAPPPIRMDVTDRADGTRLTCRFAVFQDDAAAAWALGRVGPADEPCLMITLRQEYPDAHILQLLRERYCLTGAEAAVALAIASGQRPDAIASAREVSVWTVRNQLKSAMSKLGVSRQAELVARVERTRRQG